ncbi:MAG: NADH-quinone oxidoreductase subunit NuoE [Pseudonocardiaceae bacterium]|nr:NADH-quinone oxidoreductase subunit NuoE [Pseudonocardiaceae bacterium]
MSSAEPEHPVDSANPAFRARPADAAQAADQASGETLSTLQDAPVEQPLPVDTSVFDEQTVRLAREIVPRYPGSRSALLPMLHLVQSVQGHISQAGIVFCAQQLGLTTAQVSAVVTFYSMYKRKPSGEHLVSVCTNALCAALGGDEIYARLGERLGSAEAPLGQEETAGEPGTPGSVTLEHVECLAACDLAPVVQVNYEYFDKQTVESAIELVDALRRGERPVPTRGAPLTSWRDTEMQLAGFFGEPEVLQAAVDAPSTSEETMVGARLAERRGWQAPPMPDDSPLPPVPDKK